MRAAPGLLECAVEVAAPGGFTARRQTDSEVELVRDFASGGASASDLRGIVVVEITDTVNTPVAEISAHAESASEGNSAARSRIAVLARSLADEIRSRCGGGS